MVGMDSLMVREHRFGNLGGGGQDHLGPIIATKKGAQISFTGSGGDSYVYLPECPTTLTNSSRAR